MKITEATGGLINDLEFIIRTHIGDNMNNPSTLYHYHSTGKETVYSMKYGGIYTDLYIGCALLTILEYLEEVYDVDFNEMPVHVKVNNKEQLLEFLNSAPK